MEFRKHNHPFFRHLAVVVLRPVLAHSAPVAALETRISSKARCTALIATPGGVFSVAKSEPSAGGHGRVYTNTRREIAFVREKAIAISLISEDRAVPLGLPLGRATLQPTAVARSACARCLEDFLGPVEF
jgi:hypothetical protein